MSALEDDGRSQRARERRVERRAQILDRALLVFAEKGYHDTAVSDLVEAAGVARGTFYQYFDSKHDVFLVLLDDLLAHLRSSLVGVDPAPDRPPIPVQLVQSITRVLQTADAHRALATIVFREAVGLDISVESRMHAFEDGILHYIAQALELGQRLGLLRAHPPRTIATLIFGGLRAIIDHEIVREPGEHDWNAIAQTIVDHHLHGLFLARESL